MKRGGSRNKKKDVVDIADVVDLWLDLARQQDELFKFGEYKGLGLSAVAGQTSCVLVLVQGKFFTQCGLW